MRAFLEILGVALIFFLCGPVGWVIGLIMILAVPIIYFSLKESE